MSVCSPLEKSEWFGPVGAWPQWPGADLGIFLVATLSVTLCVPAHFTGIV